jgi:hypothetical protein
MLSPRVTLMYEVSIPTANCSYQRPDNDERLVKICNSTPVTTICLGLLMIGLGQQEATQCAGPMALMLWLDWVT